MKKANEVPVREIRLTPEGWIFMIILGFITVGAVLRNVNLLILMAGLMYGPLIINWRIAVNRVKTLKARRSLPHRVYANQMASVQWVCENQSRLTAWNVIMRDEIKPVDLDADDSMSGDPSRQRVVGFGWFQNSGSGRRRRNYNAKVDFLQIKPSTTEVSNYRVLFTERGKYQVGPACIGTRFPFGLIVSQIILPQQQEFYVAPALGNLNPIWEQRVRSAVVGSEAIKRKRGLEDDEFYALRPWRSGDSKKNIHWRTSAKYGQPIVKQHDQPDNRDFAMLLDLHLGPDQNDGEEKCERALRFAATVVLHLGTAVQGRVAIGICGRENFLCRSRNHREIVDQAMQKFAIARTASETRLTDVLLELSNSVSASTPIYVISSRTQAEEFDENILADRSWQPEGRDESPSTNLAGRELRRVRAIWPLVRWISVDSAEFRDMYTDPVEGDEKLVGAIADKWISANVAS